MKYLQKSFSSGPASDAYRENYDRIFKKKSLSDVDAAELDVLLRIDQAHKKIDCGFPEVPEGLEQKIKELHAAGDREWAHGSKSSASAHHDAAFALGEPYGLNPLPCKVCGCYMAARELTAHHQRAHGERA